MVPGLSSSSSGSDSSTSRTLSRQGSHCSTSSSSSSSSPTVSEIQIREREDGINNDTSPVQVSTVTIANLETITGMQSWCRAVLLQSGLNESWWADSMECYTHLRNVTDLLSDGKTPYERRFGQPFEGPIIPFGSLVEYHPITAKDQPRIHQFGKEALPGLFLGYALYAGGIWKGDVLVADLEELETMDALEIYSKRLNAKEVIFPKEKGEFIFPIEDGRIKTPGGDQDLRTSTLVRHRPIQGE